MEKYSVSMPLLRLIPFLQGDIMTKMMNTICVNALTQAYPISTKKKYDKRPKKKMCQCPYSGLSHFYGTP